MTTRRTSRRMPRRTSRGIHKNPRPVPISGAIVDDLIWNLSNTLADLPQKGPGSIVRPGTPLYTTHINFTDVRGDARKIFVQFVAMDPRFGLRGSSRGAYAEFVDFRDPEILEQELAKQRGLVELAGDADGAISVGVNIRQVRGKGPRLVELSGEHLDQIKIAVLHELTHAYDVLKKRDPSEMFITWEEAQKYGGYQKARDAKYLNYPGEIRGFAQNILYNIDQGCKRLHIFCGLSTSARMVTSQKSSCSHSPKMKTGDAWKAN